MATREQRQFTATTIGPGDHKILASLHEDGFRIVLGHRRKPGSVRGHVSDRRDITPGDGEWHNVETLYRHEHEQVEPALSGPPQVATPEYRKGYDRIFGKKPAVGLA